MKYEEIIKRISFFRTQKGFSARELSQIIDKNEGYINKLENNGFEIPVPVLLELLDVFEITPQEFFAENYRSYKIDNELIDIIKKLPYDKKHNLIEFLKK